ncbi:MAG: hypothetical protein KKD47_10975 [Proteobacteria bacterium]|nr:hypothetical protein [Pseudomonadota bacterium]
MKIKFFGNSKRANGFLKAFYAVLALLIFADFFILRHGDLKLENIPLFFTIFGFISCLCLILVAGIINFIIKKDENYYD